MAVYSNYTTNEENYLEGCNPNVDVIPSYATLHEMSYHVIEASEADFNRIMMECGVSELYHLESSGTEMIYEEGKIESLKNNVTKFFKEMWEKVQGMIQKAIDTFQKKAQELRKKVLGEVDKSFLKKRIDNIPADKQFGVTYDYQNIAKFSELVRKDIEKGDADIDALYDKMVAQQKAGTKESYDNEIDKIVKQTANRVVYSDSKSEDINGMSGITKLLKDAIRQDNFQANGKWVKENFYGGVNIWKEVLEYPATKAQLKKDYKTLQKSFNDAIKKCKKADNSKRFEASAFTKAIKGYKSLRQLAVYSEQAVISCLHERYAFYRSILFKLIGVKPKNNDNSSNSTSKVSESTTTMDSISSLFDWN